MICTFLWLNQPILSLTTAVSSMIRATQVCAFLRSQQSSISSPCGEHHCCCGLLLLFLSSQFSSLATVGVVAVFNCLPDPRVSGASVWVDSSNYTRDETELWLNICPEPFYVGLPWKLHFHFFQPVLFYFFFAIQEINGANELPRCNPMKTLAHNAPLGWCFAVLFCKIYAD